MKKTLTISLKKWLRAGAKGGVATDAQRDKCEELPEGLAAESSLLSKANGRMCCLGFACKAAGVDAKGLLEVGMPDDLKHASRKKVYQAFPWLFDSVSTDLNSDTASKLASVNDADDLTNTQRKRKVIALFKANGVKVKFVP